MDGIGMQAIAEHEHELAARMLEELQTVKGVHILGPASKRCGGSA
jgi:cysteine desulfurase/selenocysteine lyase